MSDCLNSVAVDGGSFLGRGGTKFVRRGFSEGKEVAILYNCTALEIEILEKLKQSLYGLNMIRYMGQGVMLTELAPHGSVRDLQDTLEFENQKITTRHVCAMRRCIFYGLEELWELGYIHNDIAARNILVFHYVQELPDETFVKISDFGECVESTAYERDIASLCALVLELSNA